MRTRTTRAVTAVAAAALAGTAWTVYGGFRDGVGSVAAGESATAYDPGDPRQVAGSADDVFHAEVLRHTGRRVIAEIPSDVYEVRVLHAFKGGLRGTVTITEDVGHGPLTPGAAYVLATASWAGEASGMHALLEHDTPATPDLSAPASPPAGPAARVGATVGEYWEWAVAHQVDVTPDS
ncbi:hypothetical protein [Streptomyces indicus]|uniref:Uncharacterized protein n=1 Tax=Streptomyces indicus TaxID=417292 RepID=A0A1G9DJB6_9ACTN|nr:hypothetical protein [Streptomyces indicus]SDK63982.1 hypothetical protein SAMN05421806_109271 [Streptomyces indicus]